MKFKYYNLWSRLIILMGLVLSFGSFIRYYIIYPDTDRMLMYVLLGLMLSGLGFLYEKYKYLHYKYDSMGEQLQIISEDKK